MSGKTWILGPCSMQDRDLFISTLDTLSVTMEGRDWYMKASFDKANRTSIEGGRGPGLEYAQMVWHEARNRHPNVKFITDVHETHQVRQLIGYVDAIQIPAFLSRQTDLIVECARYFKAINIKKGQWLGPNNLKKSVDKIKSINPNCEAWICDRGSNFGYHDLFVNFGIVDELKEYYDKVILDCTHATQRSREVYGSQGDVALAERYLVGADVFGYDGVFAEVHPDPLTSPSDGECMIDLEKIDTLIKRADAVGEACKV